MVVSQNYCFLFNCINSALYSSLALDKILFKFGFLLQRLLTLQLCPNVYGLGANSGGDLANLVPKL